MKHFIQALGLVAIVSGCASTTSRSSVELLNLTEAVAKDLKTYNGWVEADQSDFPAGLCLAKVTLSTELSDTQSANGSVSIPLAVGSFNLGGSASETNKTTTQLPFVPFYPPLASNAPKNAQQKSAWYAAWIERMQSGAASDRQFWKNAPTIGNSEEFNRNASLAAELWRIRSAIHQSVFTSAEGSNSFIYPESLVVTRSFTITQSVNGGFELAVGKKLGVGASGNQTSKGTVAMRFAPNNSLNPRSCDATSLVSPKP